MGQDYKECPECGECFHEQTFNGCLGFWSPDDESEGCLTRACAWCSREHKAKYQSQWCTQCETLSRDYDKRGVCLCCGSSEYLEDHKSWLECSECRRVEWKPKDDKVDEDSITNAELIEYIPKDVLEEAKKKVIQERLEAKKEEKAEWLAEFAAWREKYKPRSDAKKRKHDQIESSTSE